MKVMKMIVGAEQPKKEQLKQLETVINDVVLQEVINKTPLTKEKMLRKLLLEAIKKRQKDKQSCRSFCHLFWLCIYRISVTGAFVCPVSVLDIFLFFRFSGIYYSLKVKESSVMESTIARDSRRIPISRIS